MKRQINRTRASIREAFQQLVFFKRYDDIRMSDVAHAANVGRSTLYMHFKDKDAILIENMRPLLRNLANSVSGPSGVSEVGAVLDHIWSHRDRGRIVLFGVSGAKLESAVAAHVEEILQQSESQLMLPPLLVARQIAASVFSVLRPWLRGEVALSVADLAAHICASSVALSASARHTE